MLKKFIIGLLIKRLRNKAIEKDILAASLFDRAFNHRSNEFERAVIHNGGKLRLNEAIDFDRQADELEVKLNGR